ncbi:MAG: hypothetical protein H6Q55_2904 [Deltaproteobacteria bacterium]|jgi:hypothetical protein|nr:hypothetical protein [Deltaproteobacteria bacterium]
MLAKKTSKNQLTLPKEIVKEFPGVDYRSDFRPCRAECGLHAST